MKHACLTLLLLASCSIAAAASDAQLIAEATSPLPKHLQSEARVVWVGADGSERVLQEGSNGFICFPDAPEAGFGVACVDEGVLKYLGQVPGLTLDRESTSKRLALIDAGIKNGSITPPVPGSRGYVLSGPDGENARLTLAIFLPGATAESTGLSTERSDGTWLMCPGTPDAHIMVGDIPYGRSEKEWKSCGK